MFDPLFAFIKDLYGRGNAIPLHEPRFIGNEKQFLNDCIDSTFVSSVGKYVDRFEREICEYTGSKFAVATVNGTAALHLALVLAGVESNDEVLTQALTFVATANSITYQNAHPVFLDSDCESLGLSPNDLEKFLRNETEQRKDGFTYNLKTGRRIRACIPMHTLGHAVRMRRILELCRDANIFVIEDAAESLGTFAFDPSALSTSAPSNSAKGRHTGTLAPIGVLSFNGNKIITTGGGGMLLIQDEELAKRAKFLSTTAKTPHPWKFEHPEVGYNYRLPNLNAALGCAQLENLESFLEDKRQTASLYRKFFSNYEIYEFVSEPDQSHSNYWLNAVLVQGKVERDALLRAAHEEQIYVRPMWELMTTLPKFSSSQRTHLANAIELSDRLVCLPSSVRKFSKLESERLS